MKAQILGLVGLILGLTNPIEAQWQTQSYSKFAQKYESTSAQCKAESAFPFFTSSVCERECFKCHAAVVIVIQLGCDVIHEIQPITAAVISVLRQFEEKENYLPGALRLGLVRYGLKQDIKIDLTLLDDMNDFKNIIEGVLIKNIEKIRPASNAHLVPAFEVALSLFADYDAHRAAEFQPELDDHWMWYITNGHLQCADCICYPEIGDPDFYQANVKTSMDTSQLMETEKMGEFRKWMSHSQNVRFVNDICTDFMTETDPASPCSFVDEKRSGQRICTEYDFKRKDCSKHANIKQQFIQLMTIPQACHTLNQRMKLCFIRSTMLSMFHLDKLKCNRGNQKVNIMITAPNQKACKYATHSFSGVERRIWTDNQFEDCHSANMLSYLNNWNADLGMCQAIFGMRISTTTTATCAAYKTKMSASGIFHVNDQAMTDIVGNCLLESAEKCVAQKCRDGLCKLTWRVPQPTPKPSVGPPGCDGSRGPDGEPGEPGDQCCWGLPGAPGPDGGQGKCGLPGSKGNDMPPAEVGYSLIPGEKGGVGSDGEPGENGPIGRPGSEGKPGKPGAKGVPGPQGQSGRCGPPGSRGETGAVGTPGPFGNPGNTGPAGTGIETQEYYQKYKAILRKQMEDGLDKLVVENGQVNGPRNAIKLYNRLIVLIGNSQDVICKKGNCRANRLPVAYNHQMHQTCKNNQNNQGPDLIQPPYVPPTYPAYDDIRDTTVGPQPTVAPYSYSAVGSPVFAQTAVPQTDQPPMTTTEFVETIPPSTGSYVTDEFSFGDGDSSTDSASNSNNFDTSTSTWWGNNKRKRNASKALMDRH